MMRIFILDSSNEISSCSAHNSIYFNIDLLHIYIDNTHIILEITEMVMAISTYDT